MLGGETRIVQQSFSLSPEQLAGVAAGWRNGSELGAQEDGSVGAGTRAELPDASEKCWIWNVSCRRPRVQPALLHLPGRCRILSRNLGVS